MKIQFRKMKILNIIFGFFGYIKIPTEVVKLSISQEVFLEKLISVVGSTSLKEVLNKKLEHQKVLTRFLESGRLLQ